MTKFQSTRPRGARLKTIRQALKRLEFQSTRPRGARRRNLERLWSYRVSIHAPARGATTHGGISVLLGSSFNPRAREGRDESAAYVARYVLKFQSTRPRGARHGASPIPPIIIGFNPRAREGRDPNKPPEFSAWRCFNPRAREGRDRRSMF